MQDRSISRPVLILLGVVVAIEVTAAFTTQISGVDGPSQLNLESQFNALVRAGDWLPRWTPNAFSGFGGPSFYFYPPLSLYLTALCSTITGILDPSTLFRLVGLTATIVSVGTCYCFFRAIHAQKNIAWFASVLYACGPFRLAELYARASLSSHVGYALLPLALCGAAMSAKQERIGILMLGVSLALLVLTSIPLAIVCLIGLLLTAIVIRSKLTTGVLIYGLFSGVLSLALSAWFWMRVLSVQHLTQLNYLLTEREFFFDDLIHWVNLPGLYHVALLLLSTGLIIAWFLRNLRQPSFAEKLVAKVSVALAVILVILEIPPVGRLLLTRVPILSLVQGTWRLYILPFVAGCTFIAIAETAKARELATVISLLFTVAALPLALIAVTNLHVFPHSTGPASDPPEYAPIYTVHDRPALDSVLATHVSDPDMVQDDKSVTFHRFYWPYWKLYAGGKEIVTQPDSIGRATAVLTNIPVDLRWKLEKTPLECAGLWISGIAWSALLFLVAPVLLIRRYKNKQHSLNPA